MKTCSKSGASAAQLLALIASLTLVSGFVTNAKASEFLERDFRPLTQEEIVRLNASSNERVPRQPVAKVVLSDRAEQSKQRLRTLINNGTIKRRLTERQLEALIFVESSGRNGVTGDNGKAFGVLQIRTEYIGDVNKSFGTNLWASDCQWDPELSKLVVQAWMTRYATSSCSFEQLARRHNGGPSGDQKSATTVYWTKVQKALNQVVVASN